jgi:hypothetical protein
VTFIVQLPAPVIQNLFLLSYLSTFCWSCSYLLVQDYHYDSRLFLYFRHFFLQFFSFVHMCIQCLSHFSPLSPALSYTFLKKQSFVRKIPSQIVHFNYAVCFGLWLIYNKPSRLFSCLHMPLLMEQVFWFLFYSHQSTWMIINTNWSDRKLPSSTDHLDVVFDIHLSMFQKEHLWTTDCPRCQE